MPVLARTELEESPLADLHAIADQIGIDGFRRLRKAQLIDAIIDRQGGEPDGRGPASAEVEPAEVEPAAEPALGESVEEEERERPARTRRRRSPRSRRGSSRERASESDEAQEAREESGEREEPGAEPARIASGVVEVLGNGSAFLRVDPPEPSDEDVYISAAQVRRCELVSGDRVTGPVRTPRRSERYPSLVRVDTINESSADTVAGAARFEDLPAQWPSERLALDGLDKTLEAIEWLTPIGRGSRAVIVGAHFAGKSATLHRIARALAGRDDLTLSVVLLGVRPEEIGDWQEGLEPVAALSFAASADAQAQALERAIDGCKRAAARGADAVLLIDTLDGVHPPAARKALAAARNLREGGSLTVIATAARPFGGETTVIALDAALTSSGREPIVDLTASGTLRPELLVGADGADAITRARAAAIESTG